MLSTSLALLLATPAARAQIEELDRSEKTGWYLDVGGAYGWFWSDDSIARLDAATGKVAVGHDWGKWRVDGSVNVGVLHNYEVDPIDICDFSGVDCSGSIVNFLLNVYHDLGVPEASRWTPFIGLGVGYAKGTNTADIDGFGSVNIDWDGFSVRVGAGTSYALTDSWDLTAELNYHFIAGQPDDNSLTFGGVTFSTESVNMDGISAGLGLRYLW